MPDPVTRADAERKELSAGAAEAAPPRDPLELAPPDVFDPVIEAYKKDVDRTLLRENLKLTVEERLRKFQSFLESLERWRGAANRQRRSNNQISGRDET